MKYLITFITLITTTLCCIAQNSLTDKYNVSYLNMAAGMPNNFVDDIYQDSYGFMWLSTHGGGLVRYDGYDFEKLGVGSPITRLNSNSCRNVCEDHHHRLWIAFEEGPQVLDLQTMNSVIPQCKGNVSASILNKTLSEACKRVYCDTKGCVWIATNTKIYRIAFDTDGNINSILSTPFSNTIPDIAMRDVFGRGSVIVCNNGRVSEIACRGGRLTVSDHTRLFAPLGNRYAGDIISYNGRIWLATNAGLFCSDKRQFHCSATDHTLQHDVATSLAVSPENKLIVGTLCGVDIIDGQTMEVEHWNCNSIINPLSSNFVNSLFTGNGQIWIGTETGGVVKLAPRHLQVTFYTNNPNDPESISRNAVNAMYAQPDGTIWAGVVEGGLNCMLPGTKTFKHYTTANSDLPHNSVSVLTADTRGNIWIGTWGGGMAVFNKQQPDKIWRLKPDAAHAPVLTFIGALAYDHINDGMWIGANDGILFYNLKTHQLEEPFKQWRQIKGCIGSLVTRDGKLFMGCLTGMVSVDLKSRRKGKKLFDMQHYIYKLDNPESGTFDKIISFCQTRDGKIWMGSNGYGLYRMTFKKDGKPDIKAFTTNDGLANNAVKGIAEDKRGCLWIATDYGLSVFNPTTNLFNNYLKADGLLCSQFYYNGAICSPAGIIYLGTERGMMAISGFNNMYASKPQLRFTQLLVDNQPVTAGTRYLKEDISIARKLSLHESDHSFTINFSALDFGSETQGVYSYRMKGYEDKWIKLKPGQHSVRYSTLPAGNYKFMVRYSPSIGTDEETSAAIEVSVTPYFWKSWWFVTIILICTCAVMRQVYKRRMERMREREVKALYRPIEEALKESDEPGELQQRIEAILDNQRRYRASRDKIVEADRKQAEENAVPFMDTVMNIMEANYANSKFGVQELAEAVGMNRSSLSKRLSTETGLPTSQFIRNYRLDVARRMLNKNVANRNITEIAYRVGFNDPKYFTRCFTKQYGIAPSAYKEDSNSNTAKDI